MSTITPSMARPALQPAADDVRISPLVHWLVQTARYLTDPLVLYRQAPMPVGETLVPLQAADAERLPEGLRVALSAHEHALTSIGFAPPVRGASTAFPNLRSCFSLLEHPRDRALAFVLVSHGAHVGASAVVSFRSDFEDGTQLCTSNSGVVPRTPARPGVVGVRFSLQDARALYEIHHFCVAKRMRKTARVRLTRGRDPLAFQVREAQEVQDFWVRRGYYEPVDGPALKFTAKGAILASLRGLFPWRQLTVWRNARNADEVLAQFRRERPPVS